MPATNHTVTATWTTDGETLTIVAKLADDVLVGRNGARTRYTGKTFTMVIDSDGETVREDVRIPAKTRAAMELAGEQAFGPEGYKGITLTY